MFHQKAEQYVENVPKWSGTIDGAVGNADNSSEASSKDASITGHSSDIPSLGKKLLWTQVCLCISVCVCVWGGLFVRASTLATSSMTNFHL